MTTIQTADGRLLRTQRPAERGLAGGLFPQSFAPMWSDGERMPNGLTDGFDGRLVSFDRIYRTQPVLAGVIDMIAFRASTLPFAAFTENADGSRTRISRSDGLSTLIRRPRPGQSTVHLLNYVFTSLLTHGNALLAVLEPTGSELPGMLWPLDWSYVSAIGEPGGDVEWWGTTQLGNGEQYIPADRTVHFAWPGPDGGQIGVSPLEKLGITIRIEDAAQRYQAASFRNGNRPANAIMFQGDLKRDALEYNERILEAFHRGPDNAGRTMMLPGGTDIKSLSMSAVEADLIEQRRLNREEVAIVLGLSGPSLTDSTNSALGNVAERFRAFYRDVLPPWATLVCETFESQLFDRYPEWMDRLARFDFSDKLRGEPRDQAETLKILVEGGIITRDEARYEVGKPPMGGNAGLLTLNVNNQAAIDSLDDEPQPVVPAAPPQPETA